jgi:hypothetical protein
MCTHLLDIIKTFLILPSKVINNHRSMMITGAGRDCARQNLCSGPPVLPYLCHWAVKLYLWSGFLWPCTTVMPMPPCDNYPTGTVRASASHTCARWSSKTHYCYCPCHRTFQNPCSCLQNLWCLPCSKLCETCTSTFAPHSQEQLQMWMYFAQDLRSILDPQTHINHNLNL